MGVDEAGRGPLVGDMFVAAVILDSEVVEYLTRVGVKDSKLLTPLSRLKLFKDVVTYSKLIYVRRYPPDVIDLSNINDLFIDAVNSSIKAALSLGFKPSRIYVDSPSCRVKLIKALSNLVGNEVEVIVEFDADRKYTVVAAASIVAKVLRDSYIRYLHGIYGDFGSGYPSDPKTIKWLDDLVRSGSELPPVVRRSWKTVRRLRGGGDLTRFISK